MTNPEKVYHFLKSNPGNCYCDDCIEKQTKVDRHGHRRVRINFRGSDAAGLRLSPMCLEDPGLRHRNAELELTFHLAASFDPDKSSSDARPWHEGTVSSFRHFLGTQKNRRGC